MRWMFAAALMLSACEPPCVASSGSGRVSCGSLDGGAAVVVAREYQTLDEVFVDDCSGEFDGGTLSFTVERRVCKFGASQGSASSVCRMPPLPPGRYPLGEKTLVLPGDGGVSTCE